MKRHIKNLFRHASRVSAQKRSALRVFAWLAVAGAAVTAATSGLVMAVCVYLFANGVALCTWPTIDAKCGLTPRTINYVTGFQGVANSALATLNIPVNRRYHSMRIWCTVAGALSDPTTVISSLQLVVNGVTMLDATPQQLIDIAKTFRVTPGTGELPIFFTQPWRNDTRTAEATSWDMFGQNTFVLRATFLNPGGGAVGATVTTDFDLERNVRVNRQTGRREPFLAILKQFNINVVAGAGVNDVVTLPKNFPIQRLLMEVSANAISSAVILADGNNKIFEATKAENQNILNANLITGTFFEYPIIFDYDSKLGSNLRVQDLDLQLTLSGAATVTITVQQLVPGYV